MNYSHWIAHFEKNRRDRPEPEWDAPFAMAEEKRRSLARSLSEYQLGDGGGECRLVAADTESFRGSAEEVRRVVDLWFAEEREHSRLLAGAVRRVGGAFVTTTPAFELFYLIRRRLGVQFEMLLLLIVEIVSTGYYRVIRRHVGDEPIAQMCKLILRDEARHIDFHRDRLAARHPCGVGCWWALHFRFLGQACAWFLWFGHGRALRALGGTRAELFHHVRSGVASFLSELAALTACASTATTERAFSNSARPISAMVRASVPSR
jgi:hypothetical protein